MRNAPETRGRRGRIAAAFAWVAVCVGCASGGGDGAPVGPEAAELFAAFSGRWELDAASSSAQIPNRLEGVQDEAPVADVARNESREMRRYRRMVESRRVSVAHMRTTVEVLRRRPEVLVLRMNASELGYTPIPGTTLVVPMDGTEVEAREGEHRVRTKIGWQGRVLRLEHYVVAGGRVMETIEVVGDRMVMTRTLASAGDGDPLVLAYDRS